MVQLDFPLLAGPPVRTGRVDAWVKPPQVGTGGGDVAGLVLNEDAPANVAAARMSETANLPGTRLRVFGYPGNPPRETGAWVDVDLKGEVGGQLIQVESRGDQTIKAQPGYSGSPVWNDGTGLVVGLLHATAFADEEYRDAYLLPPGMVAQAWEEQFDYLLVPDNPYRGLEPFTAEHHELFFGRDRDIDALTDRVMEQPVVVVVGSSGVGKSSLVQAGLLPGLQAHRPWSVALVRPGQDPWYRLAAGLLRAQRVTDPAVPVEEFKSDIEREIQWLRDEGFGRTAQFLRSEGRPLLVIVDQFEELLASRQPPEQRLLDLLLPPPEATDDATHLVHTLRADFLPALLTIPGVGSRLDQRLYPLSPLTDDQVRHAVERPAATCGVEFEDGLVDQIVSDAATGSLPLLEFTLTRLWQTQRRKTLEFIGYHKMGGVRGALDQFAEQQVSKLHGATADVVDRVLLRLIRTAPGDAELATRQRTHQSTLPPAEWQVLRQLAEARLVVVDTDPASGPYAELAHEALIDSWKRLHNLVRDNADFLGWLAGIQRRVSDGDPLPEARIAEARQWLDTRPDDIPQSVKAFVDSSQTVAEARLRELSQAHNRAEALRLAADSELALRSGRPPTTIALAVGAESILTEPTLQGDLALRHLLGLLPRTVARIDHDAPVSAVAFASDGTRVATGSDDGSARVFDAATGAELARLDHDGRVRAVAFASDGTRVATGSDDGSARVFNAATSAELTRLDHDAPVSAVAFAPDGTRVATASLDGSARVFEAQADLLLARVVGLMARPLDAAELRRYSLPWNCRHIERWARYRADAGDANAARQLVDLLLSRNTDHALSEAEGYCQWLADREVDMRAELGAIAVHHKAYDRAVGLWREAAQDGNGAAAVSLALVEAVNGRVNEALAVLHIAAEANVQQATTYAAIIDRTATDAQIRQLRVAADADNTKAINFLGVSALMARDPDAAGHYWARSAGLGDWTAPLLHAQLRNR